MHSSNTTLYSSDVLSLTLCKKRILQLQTDKGIFVDENDNMIGRTVYIYKTTDLDGNVYYEIPYKRVKQYVDGDTAIIWEFNGVTYERIK